VDGRRPGGRHAAGRSRDGHAGDRHGADAGAFTPSFEADVFGEPLDTGPFEPCWDTGPMRRIRDTDSLEDLVGAGSVVDPSPSAPVPETRPLIVATGPFQRVVIPGASSTFDAFSRTGGVDAAAYRGRRRRLEPPVEEWSADLAPRGRRHRASVSSGPDGRELVGAISATSTGRPRRGRHRA
jgi:hypothetical protein